MLALVLTAVAVVAAGCGSGSSNASAAGGSTTSSAGGYGSPAGGSGTSAYGGSTGSSGAMSETVAAHGSSLGTILVDGQGKTLYLFESDTPSSSSCDSGCTVVWPPVLGTPKAGSGIAAAKLGTIRRSDGSMQATYAGHPLYWYEGDTAAGDTNGQGLDDFGAEWYAIAPSGAAVTSDNS